jgi:hypothetical protein
MLGLLGLRIFEACGSDINDVGEEHGHQVLRVIGKGTKTELVPLPPAVGRAIDRAVDDRATGAILLNRRGRRMDRHCATRRLRRLAETSVVRLPRMHPHMLRHTFVTTMIDPESTSETSRSPPGTSWVGVAQGVKLMLYPGSVVVAALLLVEHGCLSPRSAGLPGMTKGGVGVPHPVLGHRHVEGIARLLKEGEALSIVFEGLFMLAGVMMDVAQIAESGCFAVAVTVVSMQSEGGLTVCPGGVVVAQAGGVPAHRVECARRRIRARRAHDPLKARCTTVVPVATLVLDPSEARLQRLLSRNVLAMSGVP